MIRWKNTPWGGRVKLVLFSLTPMLLVLALAQACAYMSIERTIEITTDSITGQTYYSMRIGRWPWSHRSLTPLNTLGLPDEEFVESAPKGECVHVLLAGDSFTFGDAISASVRWTTLLEDITARRAPDRCIRFFNIGIRNTTIDTTIVRIRQVIPLVHPDVVILGQYQNDLTDLANPGSPAWVPPGPSRPHDNHWGTRLARSVPGYRISLVRFATYQAFAFMIRNDVRYDVLETWSVLEGDAKREFAGKLKTIYRDLYASLVEELEAQDIEVAALIFPSKMDLLAKRSPEETYFTELAKEFDVPYLSLMPALDSNRSVMPYHIYDGHLNEIGNRIVADEVWKWLFTTHPAPVASLDGAGDVSATTHASEAR